MEAQIGFTDEDDSSIGNESTHPGRHLVKPEEWPTIAEALGLSLREWEVVVMLFQGRTRSAVARKLGIGSRTVRHYLEQIHRKLQVQDRVELVLKVIEARDRLREREAEN